MTRLWRALAVLWLLLGVAGVALREAPALTWAVPLHRGDDLAGWRVVDVGRTETAVHVTVERDQERRAVRIEHRVSAPGPAPLRRTDRYRLDPAGPLPEEAALDALVARLTAWHATTPSPPAFVRPAGHVPTPVQRAERLVLDAMALLWGFLLLWTAPRWPLPSGWGRGLAGAAGVGAVAAGLIGALGTAGVWHSNQHGFERVADLTWGTPPWAASLGLLHGFGFYTLMTPLVGGGPDGGRDVLVVAAAVALASLALWQLAFHLFFARRPDATSAATLATAALAWSPVFLRVAPTEAMYVPALLWLGGAALGTELFLATGRHLGLVLLPLGLAMQTRADLLVLAPAAVAWRALSARPDRVADALRRPGTFAAVGVWGASFVPRILDFLAIDKPGDAGRPLVDPVHDPRTVLLVLVGTLGLIAHPWVAARLPRAPAAVVAPLTAALTAGWTWAWWHRPEGYDPGLAIHGHVDATVAAPVVGGLTLLGIARLRRDDPADAAWLATSLAAALLVYLGRYDCLSTYLATGLATAPLWAAAAGASVTTAGGRALAGGALLVAALTSPVLHARYPKQQQGDLLARLSALPAGTTLVWLDDADVPADAHGWRGDRLPLRRVVGDTFPVLPLRAWLAGDRPAGAVFVRTIDCHRPVLSRRGPPMAWLGDRAAAWSYRAAYAASTGPRYRVEGLDDAEVWLHPDCAAALAVAVPREEVPLTDATSGSIYEEVRGADAAIGLYDLPPP